MKLEGLSLIGRTRAKALGKPVQAMNPTTGTAIGPDYFFCSREDVATAANLAAQAFTQFSRWTGKQRAGLLRRIAELIEANGAAIQERANLETGLPLGRLQAETGRTCGQLRLFASLLEEGWWVHARIDHGDPNRKPVPKPDVRSLLVPIGPVAVFSATNFPLAFSVAGGDTASALAAGCPVLVKANQGHYGTSEAVGLLVQQAAADCDAPEGVFSLLFGAGRDIGIALVRHEEVKAVGFTGSRAGGRALMDAASSRDVPIPVYAEMSSINPTFLFRGVLDQKPAELATGLHGSVTLGVGQFCTNPGLVFVEAGAGANVFQEKLEALVTATPAGTMLTSDLCASYAAGVDRLAKISGVRRLASGKAAESSTQGGAALFMTDVKTFLGDHALMDEVFGPSTLIVQCSSREEMVTAARRLEGQLTATIHATSEELAANRELVSVLTTKAGRLLFNGFPTGVEVCHSMTHGGPYPATSDGRSTSVGTRAIERFIRPLAFQDFPDDALPDELKDSNPLMIPRLVNGKFEAV